MTEGVETRSILLVDDNADDRARVHRLLRGHRRKYAIVDCASGAEALAILRKGETHFDCALLDQYLSDMEGVEVLNRLRGSRGQVPLPVTMLTGHGNDAAAAYALELGAEDYLLKDEVTPHALVRSIENVIEKFEIRHELESQRAAIELRNDRLESMRAEAESRLAELAAVTRELLVPEIEWQVNEEQRRKLDRIRAASRHLLDLISDALRTR
jgi:CheY-like chemotaxis protein